MESLAKHTHLHTCTLIALSSSFTLNRPIDVWLDCTKYDNNHHCYRLSLQEERKWLTMKRGEDPGSLYQIFEEVFHHLYSLRYTAPLLLHLLRIHAAHTHTPIFVDRNTEKTAERRRSSSKKRISFGLQTTARTKSTTSSVRSSTEKSFEVKSSTLMYRDAMI